jgi:hypothetical protein
VSGLDFGKAAAMDPANEKMLFQYMKIFSTKSNQKLIAQGLIIASVS